MLQILKKLMILLDKKQKLTMLGLVILMIIGAFLQTAGVGMLVEVVNIAMDPAAIERSSVASFAYRLSGVKDYSSFSILVMLALIIIFVVKNVFLFFQQKLTLAFVYTNQFRTSESMMKNYIRRSYEFFLNADTAVVQRSITSDVNNMYALILAILQLISDGAVSLFIFSYCFINNGIMTLLLAIVLFAVMWVIKKVLKPIMHKAGQDNQHYYSNLFKWISQTVHGIKEVKINGKEKHFIDNYRKCGEGYVSAVQKYTLYNSMPKLFIETACVATMMGYMIFMVLAGKTTEDLLNVLTTLAAASFILLPCVNRINNQINSIAYFEPFFMGVSDNLQYEISAKNTDVSFATDEQEKLPIHEKIELKDITYVYPNTEKYILQHANMVIPVGASVGIVGASGAGKSTIVDVMLGLLEPMEGTIYADQTDVKTQYRKWLKNIGYIPQMIFMLDDTIRKNIAFGVAEEQIDEERVWKCLEDSQLDEFVKGLPEGLDTSIGERGIRLSGGQRQRIGIARALYNDPDILVLDEATSALDNDTEKAIMDSINMFQGKKTLVIIAHRLQTIEKCDLVYRVEGGKAELEINRLS